MTTLSIILPTLNSSATIGRALMSILGQTFSDWEILLMDGDSSDDTVAIAKGYNDDRIKIHVAQDKGIYDAMNHGIQKAQGEWLYFLGSDDYLLEPTALEKMLINTNGYDMIYGDVESMHLPPEHSGEWDYENLLFNRCHQGIFYHRTVFDHIGLYPLKYPICADYYINLRIILNQRMHTQYRPVVVAHHSDGGASQTTSDIAFYSELDRMIIRYGLRTLPHDILIKHCQRALKNHCMRIERVSINILLFFLELF